MPRPAPKLDASDPTPGALPVEALVADGVAKKAEALRLLSCGETRLKELVRAKAIPSWKDGRDRVYPRAGLLAYLATQARAAGHG